VVGMCSGSRSTIMIVLINTTEEPRNRVNEPYGESLCFWGISLRNEPYNFFEPVYFIFGFGFKSLVNPFWLLVLYALILYTD
jgi:hypothetical protein